MIEVKFFKIDSWNRPVFTDTKGNYYGSVEKLFDYGSNEEDVLKIVAEDDLVFFGRSFDCEPWGDEAKNLVIIRR